MLYSPKELSSSLLRKEDNTTRPISCDVLCVEGSFTSREPE